MLLLRLEDGSIINKYWWCDIFFCRKDSTGIPHILEHSVLCGSRKYPVKEPFVELLKGSLHTFLNAFTYPDRTCYPVASTNLQVSTGLCTFLFSISDCILCGGNCPLFAILFIMYVFEVYSNQWCSACTTSFHPL